MKRIMALLLAIVLLLGSVPVTAQAEETQTCQHQYEETVTAPGCSQEGYTTYLCTLCGDTYTDHITDPTGVCVLELAEEAAPSCILPGTAAHYKCVTCDKLYLDEEGTQEVTAEELALPLSSCTLTPVAEAASSCTQPGTAAHYKCTCCDKLYLDEAGMEEVTAEDLVLPPSGCALEFVEEAVPNCTQPGTAAHYKCTGCDKLYLDEAGMEEVTAEDLVLPPSSCDLEPVAEVTPSCIQSGTAGHYKCTGCDKLYWDDAGTQEVTAEDLILPPGSCALQAVKEVASSCTTAGTAAHYKCGVCDKLYLDEAGTKEVTKKELVLPLGSCKLTAVKEVAPSCAKPGTAAHYKCGVCGKLYLDKVATKKVTKEELKLPQLEHSYGAWQTAEKPGPEKNGKQQRKCTLCGDQQTKSMPPLEIGLSTPKVTISVSSASGKPVLSWSAVQSAKTYHIYLYDTQTGEKTFLKETSSRSYTYTAAKAGQRYAFVVAAANTTKCSRFSTWKSALCKCGKPVVKVASNPDSGKPVLTWAAVEGAKEYAIYRSTSKSSGFEKLTAVKETTYEVTSSKASTLYYYKIKAVGKTSEANSSYSSTVSHTCDCARPVATATSGSSKGIKVSWGKVSGAKKYYVYRASSKNGKYTRIATTSSTSYTDTKAPKNKVSYYKVRGYGKLSASLSAYSQVVSAKNHTFGSWKTITPNTPEAKGLRQRTCSYCAHVEKQITPVLERGLSTPKLKLKTGATSGRPVLSWGTVKSATRYQIYLCDNKTGEKTFLAETSSKSYTYTKAVPGEKYTFRVVAANSTKCSAYSSASSIVCACATPEITVASQSKTGKPVLSWKQISGASTYSVYRSTSKSSGYTRIAKTQETSYTVTDSSAGKLYYYKIKAVGPTTESTSNYSNTVGHTCDCAQPVAAAESGSSGGIKVSWGKVSGAKNYYVYRASSEKGTYTKIATTSSTSYTDTKAAKNKVSYYKVRAIGSRSSSLSAYSQVVSAKNHTFGSWKTITASTPEAAGQRQRTCSYCDFTQTQTIPKLSQSLSKVSLTVTTSVASGKPTLSWKSVSKATAYRIYLYNSSKGSYTYLTKTTSRSYVHTAAEVGKQYTYAVVAVNASACSPFSAGSAVTCRLPIPDLQLSKDPEANVTTLSWDAVKGAAGYAIYRSTVSNSDFTHYKTTQGTSCTITDETPGVRYYYKISATHKTIEAANSGYSSVCYFVAAKDQLVIHAGTLTSKCNKVVWDAVEDAIAYKVYRATSKDGTYKTIATAKGTEYVDLGISAGTTYYYKVKAVGEEGETIGAESQPKAANKPSQVPLKIYVSPSCQTRNMYAYGGTNEAAQCRKIAKILVTSLQRCGFTAMTNTVDDMDVRMAQSNEWGANLHLPIHTNALNGRTMGTQLFTDGVSGGASQKVCQSIMNVLGPLTPGSGADVIRSYKALYEINHSNAPTAYVEVAFHDTKTEAKWILENREEIAEAICEALCKTYGMTYIAP